MTESYVQDHTNTKHNFRGNTCDANKKCTLHASSTTEEAKTSTQRAPFTYFSYGGVQEPQQAAHLRIATHHKVPPDGERGFFTTRAFQQGAGHLISQSPHLTIGQIRKILFPPSKKVRDTSTAGDNCATRMITFDPTVPE